MSETYSEPAGSTPAQTGWVGWIMFAAVIMMIAGGLNIFYGIVAALNDEWVVWANQTSVYLDISQWGWVHIILGAVVLLSGVGLLTGNVLARSVGVAVAAVSLILNFFFIPAYPLWSLTVITLDVLVIWALTVHGHETRVP